MVKIVGTQRVVNGDQHNETEQVTTKNVIAYLALNAPNPGAFGVSLSNRRQH